MVYLSIDMMKSLKNFCLFILMTIFLLLSVSCGPITREIKYEVTGTIPVADITYANFTAETDKLADVTLPWSKSFTVAIDYSDYFTARLSASKYTSGSLTANIYVNGTLVKTSTDSGSHPSVSIYESIWN